MAIILREGNVEDAQICGEICCKSFTALSDRHGFPPHFPDTQAVVDRMAVLLSHPGYYSVVAEEEGRIVGSNFLDERSVIAWPATRRFMELEEMGLISGASAVSALSSSCVIVGGSVMVISFLR